MFDYQIWGFTYLNFGKDDINVITGTKEEADCEAKFPCFDGVAYFTFLGKYYIAQYPKLSELTDKQKEIVEQYCGYKPETGEYGVVMGALGEIYNVTKTTYKYYEASYEVSKQDRQKLF